MHFADSHGDPVHNGVAEPKLSLINPDVRTQLT